MPPLDPNSIKAQQERIRSPRQMKPNGNKQSTQSTQNSSIQTAKFIHHKQNLSASRSTAVSTSGSYASSSYSNSSNKPKEETRQSEQQCQNDRLGISLLSNTNNEGSQEVNQHLMNHHKSHSVNSVSKSQPKQKPTNSKVVQNFKMKKGSRFNDQIDIEKSLRVNKENIIQNNTIMNNKQILSTLSSFKESFVDSESFCHIEEKLEQESQLFCKEAMQKSLKQLIREKFLGPIIVQKGAHAESLWKRNILLTTSNCSNRSSMSSSSFKSSFVKVGGNRAECNTKQSFQSRCEGEIFTQEETDEHITSSSHFCDKISEYALMPKTIFNRIIGGLNQDESDSISNPFSAMVTSVPQQSNNPLFAINSQRVSRLSKGKGSPYKNISNDQSQQDIDEEDDEFNEGGCTDRQQQDNDSCQEDIIEFLQSDTHKMHLIQTLQSLQYVKNHLKAPPASDIKIKKVMLPPFRNSWITKTIIFDLDETLVHCVEDFYNHKVDKMITVTFPNGDKATAGLNIRPYAIECLRRAAELFQVVVFTASHQSYADVVLDLIDPHHEIFVKRLYRDSCVRSADGVYVKDLRIFDKCRKMEDIVIVDNAVYSFGYQLENGIPIIPFYQDKEDEELLHLTQYLECLVKNGGDVREHNRKAFQLRELQDLDVQQFLANMLQETNNRQSSSQQQNHLQESRRVKSQVQWEALNVDSDIINEESNEEDESLIYEQRRSRGNRRRHFEEEQEGRGSRVVTNTSVLDDQQMYS